jgi:hypothetical protein
VPWRQWGPYVSERQWGTVREDYSEDGNAWNYFSHDQARSRAYHWGLWSKQYFFYDVNKWLQEHHVEPTRPTGQVRNREWFHLISGHVISMPDKWEYPWFAAWDLAFHTIALATVDVDFAKHQLDLLLLGLYLHPTGQIPAYEWNFSDINPPVHAWATIFLYRIEQALQRPLWPEPL